MTAFGFYIFITGAPIIDPVSKFIGIYLSVSMSWGLLTVGEKRRP
jgi:hypothetical protein